MEKEKEKVIPRESRLRESQNRFFFERKSSSKRKSSYAKDIDGKYKNESHRFDLREKVDKSYYH